MRVGPWLSRNRLIMKGEVMRLFERTHLPDKTPSGLYRGPSRGLPCNGPMVSTTLRYGRLQGGPLTTAGVDAAWRRAPGRALTSSANQNSSPSGAGLECQVNFPLIIRPYKHDRYS